MYTQNNPYLYAYIFSYYCCIYSQNKTCYCYHSYQIPIPIPDDAVAFLHRCIAALKPHGLIFVKENICNEGFIVDSEDASVTRSHEYYMELFTEKAGLRVVDTALQKGFPRKLFKVRMYAVR